jgi:hypothetical protein
MTIKPTENAMSPIPHATRAEDRSEGGDKVLIQTYEGDLDTLELRLTATIVTIVTSMAELRARASAGG